jgi:hypothetical protein
MLTIRSEQMAVFGRAAREAFERRLLSHIRTFFPVHWREAGAPQLRAAIRLGMANAAVYGLETEREIHLYVSLMLYLGSWFDTDPQLPWAAGHLKDPSVPDPFFRIEKTYGAAVRYLERVSGPGGQYGCAAVRRFTGMARDLAADSPPALFERLCPMYPEKYRELRPDQLQALWNEGMACARRHGLEPARGVALAAALQLLLGHGFGRDPVFPWAEEALNGAGATGPRPRAEALAEASVLHLGRWFGLGEELR